MIFDKIKKALYLHAIIDYIFIYCSILQGYQRSLMVSIIL